jgi:peptidoglycan/xylan/chitin deacetylase (PgdA/CDA1 family)
MHRYYIASFLTLSFLIGGCYSLYEPEQTDILHFSIHAEKKYISVSDSLALWIAGIPPEQTSLNIEWNASNGRIIGAGSMATFFSPTHLDTVTISVTINTSNGIIYTQSRKLYVYRQLIILKADDLVFDGSKTVSNRWSDFFSFVKTKNIKAGVGLIGDSLRKGNKNYHDLIKTLHTSEHFEIWNHGYSHVIGTLHGSPMDEFRNSSFESQLEQLRKTQNDAKKYAGITLRAFGAPGNAVDVNTVRALNELDEIKVWFFGLEGSNKLILDRCLEIEFVAGSPDYNKFYSYYPSRYHKEYLVLNIHPNAWDSEKFSEFKKIVDYLIEQEVTFITPQEYYEIRTNNSNFLSPSAADQKPNRWKISRKRSPMGVNPNY